MILQMTKEQLIWEETQHHEDFVRLDDVMSVLYTELFYYKNDDVTIHATMQILEHSNRDNNFELLTNSYTHAHPELIRLEFRDSHKIGDYKNLEEAKDAAQVYFNHHHQTNRK